MGRRFLVKGSIGAGKSTLGRALAERLGVRYVELDALYHGPDWTPATAEELQARVRHLLDDDIGWVVDGNYDSKLGTLLVDRADTIVWLDLPLHTKLTRAAKRTAQRWLSGQELWNGNREQLKNIFWGGDSLLVWAIQAHFRQRQHWPGAFAGARLVRLRSPSEVDAWLAGAAPLATTSPPCTTAAPAPGSAGPG